MAQFKKERETKEILKMLRCGSKSAVGLSQHNKIPSAGSQKENKNYSQYNNISILFAFFEYFKFICLTPSRRNYSEQ